MFKGFIFDLDGVITDTAELHHKAWSKLADSQGWTLTHEMSDQLRGRSRDACIRLIAPTRLTDKEYANLAEQKNEMYVESLSGLTQRDLLPGIFQFIKKIRDENGYLAIASASKNTGLIMERLNISRYFDGISDGNSVTNSKPDADVFLHASGQLRLPVTKCVVFEDAATGIEGAKSAGFATVGIGNHLAPVSPDWLVSCTSELIKLDLE